MNSYIVSYLILSYLYILNHYDILSHHGTITAPSLHHHCTITVLCIGRCRWGYPSERGSCEYRHCTITAPSLHHHCTVTYITACIAKILASAEVETHRTEYLCRCALYFVGFFLAALRSGADQNQLSVLVISDRGGFLGSCACAKLLQCPMRQCRRQ